MEVRRIQNSSPNELYHHGIIGQEWGKMHGPPYPLDKQTSAAVKKEGAVKKKKNIFERHRDKKKMKKLRKIRDQKQAEKKERERIINSGDANEIDKIKNNLSDEEYARALSRISLNQSLSEYKTATNRAKLEDIANKVSTVSKVVGNVANAADAGIKVYQGLQNAGIIEKKQSNMDQLKAEKTRLELLSDIADLTNKITDSKSKNQKEITKLKNQTEFEKANFDLEDIKKKREDLKNGPDKLKQLEKDSKEWEYMAKIAKNKNAYEKNTPANGPSNSTASGNNGKKDKSDKKTKSSFDSNVDVDKAKRKKLDSKQDVNIAKTFVDAGLVPDVKKGLKGSKRAAVQAGLVRQVYQNEHPGTFNQADFKTWLKQKGYDQQDINYLTGGGSIKHGDPNMSNVRRIRDDELYHHGIKGQRWGIRRYQNEDGSLKDAGKARYVRSTLARNERKYGEANSQRAINKDKYEGYTKKANKAKEKGNIEKANKAKSKAAEYKKLMNTSIKDMKTAESANWKTIAKAVENGYDIKINSEAGLYYSKVARREGLAMRYLFGIAGGIGTYAMYGNDKTGKYSTKINTYKVKKKKEGGPGNLSYAN